MHDSMRGYGGRRDRTAFERITEQAMAYLRSRTADHWLMFVAGLVRHVRQLTIPGAAFRGG
jgi:hypothetical protein